MTGGGSPLSFALVLRNLQQSSDFRSFVNSTLVDSSFDAFRWETPPVTKDTVTRDFEYVLVRDSGLARTPDRSSFAEHFQPDQLVVAFPNLRGDSTLVVPCPVAEDSQYAQLADFCRHAPDQQIHEFWRRVGEETAEHIDESPLWLSTAGMGVPWLHVRLDRRPKYYSFAEYRRWD